MKIGFDISGGDFAPNNCLEGAILAFKELPADARVVLIGDSNNAHDYFKKQGIDENLFEVVLSAAEKNNAS